MGKGLLVWIKGMSIYISLFALYDFPVIFVLL